MPSTTIGIRRRRFGFRGSFAAIAVLVAVSRLHADTVCVQFAAHVDSVSDRDNLLGGAIGVGDTITGTYRYDSTTPDTNASPSVGDYWQSTAPYGISVQAGPFVFQTDPARVEFLVEIVDDLGSPTRDNYLLRSYRNLPLSNGVPVEHISWQLDDSTASALSSPALPTAPPVLSSWQSLFGMVLEGKHSGQSHNDFAVRTTVSFVASCTAAGSVPDGSGGGIPLTLSKTALNEVRLSWGASCMPGDSDYAIYGGILGQFQTHVRLVCSTGGATDMTLASSGGDRTYFLVVPRNATNEGSYGVDSSGVERAASFLACVPQDAATACP